jgi:hypothetical protein
MRREKLQRRPAPRATCDRLRWGLFSRPEDERGDAGQRRPPCGAVLPHNNAQPGPVCRRRALRLMKQRYVAGRRRVHSARHAIMAGPLFWGRRARLGRRRASGCGTL